jgi:hypothetical protein
MPRPSVTTISFGGYFSYTYREHSKLNEPPDHDPVAPSNASVETIQAPGATSVFDIPQNTTVITIDSTLMVTTAVVSKTVRSESRGPVTLVSTVTSTMESAVVITIGPGGGVVGNLPTSVSQPGFVVPTFSEYSTLSIIYWQNSHGDRLKSCAPAWRYGAVEFFVTNPKDNC